MKCCISHLAVLAIAGLSLAVSASAHAFDDVEMGESPAALTGSTQSESSFTLAGSSYAVSDQNAFGDSEILWPGFLTGMRSTTSFHLDFAEPVGNPIYFESPFIDTQMKFFYLWHDFPSNGQIGGGQANVWGLQIRVALTERLALIAPKDGWSEFNAGILPRASGWNDFMVGLKYAVVVDEPNEFILTAGMRWEWHQGSRRILQGGDGGDHELSPFISFAKTWEQFNFIGNLTARVPLDLNDGNCIISWDLHMDWEVAPERLPGFHPLIELHALHYVSNADRFPVDFGGLDYTNIGASDVAGSSVFWGDLGFRWKLTPNLSIGAAYGFPISNPGNDIFNQRVTVDFIASF